MHKSFIKCSLLHHTVKRCNAQLVCVVYVGGSFLKTATTKLFTQPELIVSIAATQQTLNHLRHENTLSSDVREDGRVF